MSKQIINIGLSANDRSGDPLRVAFDKVNQNFTELYSALGADATIFDPLNVDSNIVPDADNTRDLGSPTKQWRHVYTAGGSIYLDNIKLTNVGGKFVATKVINPGEENEEDDPEDSDATSEIGGGGSSDRLVNGETEVVLKTDGSISLPSLDNTGYQWNYSLNGPTLKINDDPTNQTIITGPTPTSDNPSSQRLIIQGQRGYGVWGQNIAGEGGDIYLWAGTGGESDTGYGGSGGDIKIRGGQGQDAEGGYVKIEGGDSQIWNGMTTGAGGQIDITAGDSIGGSASSTGGNINITGGRAYSDDTLAGQITLTAGGHYGGGTAYSWTFRNDGSLQLPSGKPINFGQNMTTLAAPAANGTTDRIRLWDFQGGDEGDSINYAIGAEPNHMWFSVDMASNSTGFKFYGGINEIFKITGDGKLHLISGGDIVDHTGTSVLGGGGATTGNVNFQDTSIYTPEGVPLYLETTYGEDYPGLLGNRVTLNGNAGRITLAGYSTPVDASYGGGAWDSAEWTTNEYNQNILRFTNATMLEAYLDSDVRPGYDRYFRVNAESSWLYWSGVSNSGGGVLDILLDMADEPPVDPTTITQLDIKFQRESVIDINPSNDEILIQSRGADVNIISSGTINLTSNSKTVTFDDGDIKLPVAGDILNSSGGSVIKLRPIRTVAVTTMTYLTVSDEIVLCDPNAAGGDVDLYFPDVPGEGKIYTVKNINSGNTYVGTISGSIAMETESGIVSTGAYATINVANAFITWVFSNNTWRIIGRNGV